jgi:glycosyltransferase involved in cell wall biosynthesis
MVDKRPIISIVTPFFNESGNVQAFYQAISSELSHLSNYLFEVICIDDGSNDSTLLELLEVIKNDNRFRVIELSRNFGKEAALSAGLDAAKGDAVIIIDADLQDPASLVSKLINTWERSGVDIVLAKRVNRSNDSRTKRSTAKAYYRLHNFLSSVKIPADVGDCRLMTREVVQALMLLPETQRFMKGLFTWVGFSTTVIEYDRELRLSGSSKFTWWRLWNFGIEGITSFSTMPLRVWTYIGIAGAILTTVFGLYVFFKTLFMGTDVPGYASLFIAILFFGSVQLIGLGILGEYIGRIYLESKRRPSYIIRRVHSEADSEMK